MPVQHLAYSWYLINASLGCLYSPGAKWQARTPECEGRDLTGKMWGQSGVMKLGSTFFLLCGPGQETQLLWVSIPKPRLEDINLGLAEGWRLTPQLPSVSSTVTWGRYDWGW